MFIVYSHEKIDIQPRRYRQQLALKAPIQQMLIDFALCLNVLEASCLNSIDSDQTAPIDHTDHNCI